MAINIFWSNEVDLRSRGFERVAHVPCLFDGKWQYQRAASTYLVERALLDWPPGTKKSLGNNRMPTKQSLRTYAESLSNFLEWIELRGINWQTATYAEHLLGGYQKEMAQGSWSSSGRPLAPSTINARLQEACNFLTWSATRGLREDFPVQTTILRIAIDGVSDSHGHRTREVESRIGKVRLNPKNLRLPTDADVRKWLTAVRIQRGETKALMVELIMKTAVRREEAAAWRVDTLPERLEEWELVGNQVSVDIKFGAKGQAFGEDHGDKIGPKRTIWMPITLAQKLHEYRRGKRLAARAQWARSATTRAEQRSRAAQISPHLFLSDATGERVTAKSLYEAWTGAGHLPFKGWSPHLGRHYWACKTLLLEAKKRAELIASKVDKLPVDWITANSRSDIQLLIKPQLGHVALETTEMYLTWVARIFAGGEMQLQYADHLDRIEQEAQDVETSIG